MRERTITLPGGHAARLRNGKRTWWDDSDGREVLVRADGAAGKDYLE